MGEHSTQAHVQTQAGQPQTTAAVTKLQESSNAQGRLNKGQSFVNSASYGRVRPRVTDQLLPWSSQLRSLLSLLTCE